MRLFEKSFPPILRKTKDLSFFVALRPFLFCHPEAEMPKGLVCPPEAERPKGPLAFILK